MLKEAVRTVTEMDEALTGMAVVTSMSREETMKLVPAIQTLARETSTAMTEVAGLITEYTKQGRTLSEAFILAEETAKAAKIAGISAAESIQYMTSAINGFNLAASDATRVSDVFANLAAISATDYEQLAIALSKVSAQANLAGMSMEYTTALLAKGIETTQEAPESIGTALKTIVARMRELSDYGKTLEDGASVNKVESALASAGIQLRDVNGEFRDLEDIFNELGPQWDQLNTMQQQAIAQAVAGTRQQSRFVAIMQDWERTQELAAEAQDSAGASAAQYYEQAQGMEAAMTNLTTA
jgi:TP901 family phage tail tape measure protein